MRKPVIVGALSGFVIAAAVLLCGRINNYFDNAFLQQTVNFFVSVPAIIHHKAEPYFIVGNILFFLYWITIGAFFGWLAAQKNIFSRLILFCAVIALVILHRSIQVKLERELENAIRGVSEALLGMFR